MDEDTPVTIETSVGEMERLPDHIRAREVVFDAAADRHSVLRHRARFKALVKQAKDLAAELDETEEHATHPIKQEELFASGDEFPTPEQMFMEQKLRLASVVASQLVACQDEDVLEHVNQMLLDVLPIPEDLYVPVGVDES